MTFREAFLRKLREFPGISIAEIARKSGVPASQLYKLKERPDATTNVDDAIKIALAFGQTVNEFVANGNPRPPKSALTWTNV